MNLVLQSRQSLSSYREHFLYTRARFSSYPSIHCSPQMPPLPSLARLPHNKPFSPLWELFPAPLLASPPRSPQPRLVRSELKDCVQMCLEEGQAPPALGEHVVPACLHWHPLKLSPTQHAGVRLPSPSFPPQTTTFNRPPTLSGRRLHRRSC